MKKATYCILYICIIGILIVSCEFENVLGKNYSNVDVSAGSQSVENMDKNLASILNSLGSTDGKTFVTSLTDEEKANINKSDLSSLKDKTVTLSAEDKKAVNDTASFVNQYLPDSIDSGNKEVDKLVKNLKESFNKLSTADSASEGDIIGLKYTMNLLDSIANAIPEDNPIELSDGTKVNSEALLNTLFQKEDNSNPPLSSDQISELLTESDEGTKAVMDLVSSAQDYINVVGKATNFTGGADVVGLLQSFLKDSSKSSNN